MSSIRIYRTLDIVPVLDVESTVVSLESINKQLRNKKLSDTKIITLEIEKTSLIQSILSYVNAKKAKANTPSIAKKTSRRSWLDWLKVGFFGFVSVIGLLFNSLITFLGARLMFITIFPAINTIVLMAMSLLITAINSIQFIAFEVGLLKSILGVKTTTNAKKIIEQHEMQVNAIHEINIALSNINVLAGFTQQAFVKFKFIGLKLNQDIINKKEIYKEYKEHPILKAIRWALTGFGALILASGAFYGGMNFLPMVAPVLVGTVAGWLIIGTFIFSSVVFYFAMQGAGMTSLFQSTMSEFNALKNKLNVFDVKTEQNFNQTLLNKHVFKTKESPLIEALDLNQLSTYKRRQERERLSQKSRPGDTLRHDDSLIKKCL
jgi:hypothetical protein